MLGAEVEAVIAAAIDELYLDRRCPSLADLVRETERRCAVEGLAPPSRKAVTLRTRALDRRKTLCRRGGGARARRELGRIVGRLSADRPLELVQIDHTLAGVRVVSAVDRRPLGRPWLTLAIDVATRMVAGFHLDLEPPSALSVALAVSHAVLPKDAYLRGTGVNLPWPVSGLPERLHLDNAKEFRFQALARGTAEYGIDVEYRPPAAPHWGGHVERLIGTVMGALRVLPGATGRSLADRGRDPEATATMTLDELETWLVHQIAGVYHNTPHRGLGAAAITAWTEATAHLAPRRLPDDPERFFVDFLRLWCTRLAARPWIVSAPQPGWRRRGRAATTGCDARPRRGPRARCAMLDWAAHDRALARRGDVTVRVSPEAVAGWRAPAGRRAFSDAAIAAALTVRAVHRLALRQAEGLAASISALPGLALPVPDHTTLSRRGQAPRPDRWADAGRGVDPAIDSTGLGVARPPGAGREGWRKLHVAVDPGTGRTLAEEVTPSDAHDARPVPGMLDRIDGRLGRVHGDGACAGGPTHRAVAGHRQRPPNAEGVFRPKPPAVRAAARLDPLTARGRHARHVAREGRAAWERATGHGRRNAAEWTFSRLKRVLGGALRSRCLEAQRAEAAIAVAALNRMAELGMPRARRIA